MRSTHGCRQIASAVLATQWAGVTWPEEETAVFATVAAPDTTVTLSSAHADYRWMAMTEAAGNLAESFRTLCGNRYGSIDVNCASSAARA